MLGGVQIVNICVVTKPKRHARSAFSKHRAWRVERGDARLSLPCKDADMPRRGLLLLAAAFPFGFLASGRSRAAGIPSLTDVWRRSGNPGGGPAPVPPVGNIPNLRTFGALGDEHTDDTASFRKWVEAAKAAGTGYLPAGRYSISAGSVELAEVARSGVRFIGDGCQRSVFHVRNGGLKFASSAKDNFYLRISDVGFVADTEGPAVELGHPDFFDCLNSIVLDSVTVSNARRSPGAVAVRSNAVCAGDFRNVVANCGGVGVALELRQTQFSRFQGSVGHAAAGLRMTGGYSFGNAFSGFDFEELDVDVVIDVATARDNVFLANQYVWRVAAIDATAGTNNMFVVPNLGTAGLEKAMRGKVGVVVMGGYGRPGDPGR